VRPLIRMSPSCAVAGHKVTQDLPFTAPAAVHISCMLMRALCTLGPALVYLLVLAALSPLCFSSVHPPWLDLVQMTATQRLVSGTRGPRPSAISGTTISFRTPDMFVMDMLALEAVPSTKEQQAHGAISSCSITATSNSSHAPQLLWLPCNRCTFAYHCYESCLKVA
jgi:hypothetical protein